MFFKKNAATMLLKPGSSDHKERQRSLNKKCGYFYISLKFCSLSRPHWSRCGLKCRSVARNITSLLRL